MDEHAALIQRIHKRRNARRRTQLEPPTEPKSKTVERSRRDDLPKDAVKRAKCIAYGPNYSPEEESIRSSYAQQYVNTARRPQNFIRNAELGERFQEHPKLQRLLEMHHAVLERESHPAMHLRADLRSFDFDTLVPFRFDTILIDAPLAEYGQADNWSWDELAALPIPRLAAQPSFIWIWVGSGSGPSQGLERGRDLLARWGYRRCEDIVWLKSNTRAPAIEDEPVTDTLLTHTKEHCLMGIKGTVRRSTDGAFARCNIDTDVIVWEGDPDNPLAKPPELHALIENFCLGSRRLELFGSRARRGWLTLGPADIDSAEQFEQAKYAEWFAQNGALFTTTQEIDDLRPKSPPPRTARGGNPTGGIGRGRGRRESPAPPPVPAQQMQMNAQAQAFIPMPFNPMLAFYGMPQYQS